ncbi:hypothetical protein [Alteromonas sp. C1M14]|uniref:hypothetical protein n=1 Tax=Alteromonas sp. C1M14 TaxID=2841567 RepID=UPI001C0952A7|nr:hypothetical protein [Alteromonas sp. C1M14]MBU2979879.1 hypothetical protein [Alteromonas sp. C1M14]
MMTASDKHAPHEREITLPETDVNDDDCDSVAGEEDPGAALEDFVEYDKTAPKK